MLAAQVVLHQAACRRGMTHTDRRNTLGVPVHGQHDSLPPRERRGGPFRKSAWWIAPETKKPPGGGLGLKQINLQLRELLTACARKPL